MAMRRARRRWITARWPVRWLIWPSRSSNDRRGISAIALSGIGARFDKGDSLITPTAGTKDMTKNRFDLPGRVAMVTGASSGLGEHFAQVLAEAGAKVIVAARRVD